MTLQATPPVGRQLRVLRVLRDMSREQLARRLGVSVRTVIRWELGECTPSGLGARALSRWVGRAGER